MKKKFLITATLCTALLAGVLFGFASGSETNPLITKTFLDGEYKENVLNTAYTEAENEVDDTLNDGLIGLSGGDTGQFSYATLNTGDTVNLSFGESLVISSGGGMITITAGEVVNVSDGTVVKDGTLLKNNRYLATEDAVASIKMTSLSEVMTNGDVEISTSGTTVNFFNDVRPTDWFYADVMSAVEMGLINGMDATTFNPEGYVSYAQAIKLSACIHQYYHTGSVSLTNGDPWYKSYADYLLTNGVISTLPEDYDASAPRDYYIALMYYSLPSSEFSAINNIPDDSIPDFKAGADWYDEIYALYRAGIVMGSDEEHNFKPDLPVKRNEVATLIARMFDDSVRKSFNLG